MKIDARKYAGIFLIFVGGFLLLETLDIIQGDFGELFWGALLGSGGLIFLNLHRSNKSQWWWQIPGYILLGIGLGIALDAFPWMPSFITELFIFGGMAFAFVSVYRSNNDFWWAIIPAGIFTSLGAMIVFEKVLNNRSEDVILFFGFALTFFSLTLLPEFKGKTNWPLYPATVFLLIGISELVRGDAWNFIGPSLVIVIGVILLVRSVKSTKKEDYQ